MTKENKKAIIKILISVLIFFLAVKFWVPSIIDAGKDFIFFIESAYVVS